MYKVAFNVDIFLPLTGNKDWIAIDAHDDKIEIRSNLSSTKALKSFTTYMISPATNIVLDVYKGLAKFTWNHNNWNEAIRFVFEVKMQCDLPPARPIVWKNTLLRESLKLRRTTLN